MSYFLFFLLPPEKGRIAAICGPTDVLAAVRLHGSGPNCRNSIDSLAKTRQTNIQDKSKPDTVEGPYKRKHSRSLEQSV